MFFIISSVQNMDQKITYPPIRTNAAPRVIEINMRATPGKQKIPKHRPYITKLNTKN